MVKLLREGSFMNEYSYLVLEKLGPSLYTVIK